MNPLAKEYLINFYSKLLKSYGDRPEALRWTPNGQVKRYELMLEISSGLEGKKVLDFGCGKGDFFGFLSQKGINVDYTGVDINEELVRLASGKYPGCRFWTLDIEEADIEEEFDYIFACGVFNNRIEGATETMMSVLSRLFRICREGLAISGISSHSPHEDIDINYVSPEDLTGFALKYLTPYVALRHDRLPYDFTLFLYKMPNAPTTHNR